MEREKGFEPSTLCLGSTDPEIALPYLFVRIHDTGIGPVAINQVQKGRAMSTA